MSRSPGLDELAIYNGIITPKAGAQQKVSVTSTSAQSAAFITDMITIYSTNACWIRFGDNPTAAANDGNSRFIPAGFMVSLRVTIGEKLAAIRDTNDGDLHISGGA